jgi:hypothetical protein
LQPYIVRQGDHLPSLAYRFDFDADAVWNDPKNADLRRIRKLSADPNILCPTDMLYIPDPKPAVVQSLNTGTTNTFVADVPTATLNVKFVEADGTPYASKAFTVQELPELAGLTTDGSGLAHVRVPVTLDAATVVFSDSNDSFELAIGEMDPIDTLSGVFKRLKNLGYIDDDIAFASAPRDILRAGLLALTSAKSASDDPPASDASAASADAAAGLSDDGTLDAATKSVLLDAHGC